MKTEAWWVCNKCHKPIIKPGKGTNQAMIKHRKECDPIATISIKQIEQQK